MIDSEKVITEIEAEKDRSEWLSLDTGSYNIGLGKAISIIRKYTEQPVIDVEKLIAEKLRKMLWEKHEAENANLKVNLKVRTSELEFFEDLWGKSNKKLCEYQQKVAKQQAALKVARDGLIASKDTIQWEVIQQIDEALK